MGSALSSPAPMGAAERPTPTAVRPGLPWQASWSLWGLQHLHFTVMWSPSPPGDPRSTAPARTWGGGRGVFDGEGAQSFRANFHIPAPPRRGVSRGEQPAPSWPASWKGRASGRTANPPSPGGCPPPPYPFLPTPLPPLLPSKLAAPPLLGGSPARDQGTSSSFPAQPPATSHGFAAGSAATGCVTSGKLLNFSVPIISPCEMELATIWVQSFPRTPLHFPLPCSTTFPFRSVWQGHRGCTEKAPDCKLPQGKAVLRPSPGHCPPLQPETWVRPAAFPLEVRVVLSCWTDAARRGSARRHSDGSHLRLDLAAGGGAGRRGWVGEGLGPATQWGSAPAPVSAGPRRRGGIWVSVSCKRGGNREIEEFPGTEPRWER